MEYKFEWDIKKSNLNKEKHGITFEDATVVFKDPKRLELYDRKHSFFEERWTVVGINNTTILKVCFTERNGSIRIISARKANKNEEEKYLYGYCTFYIN